MSARVSVPSYVTPGTYLENLRFIDEHTDVRNVELLFFIYDDDTRSLLFSESERIAAYSDRFGFTVHMPDEIAAGHEEILEATACFASSFVIHPPKSDSGNSPFLRLFDDWRLRYGAGQVSPREHEARPLQPCRRRLCRFEAGLAPTLRRYRAPARRGRGSGRLGCRARGQDSGTACPRL